MQQCRQVMGQDYLRSQFELYACGGGEVAGMKMMQRRY